MAYDAACREVSPSPNDEHVGGRIVNHLRADGAEYQPLEPSQPAPLTDGQVGVGCRLNEQRRRIASSPRVARARIGTSRVIGVPAPLELNTRARSAARMHLDAVEAAARESSGPARGDGRDVATWLSGRAGRVGR
jgi:hypothetical protein